MLTDEQLIAYVAGTLDDAQRAKVEAALADDPQASRRVTEQQTMEQSLGALLGDVALERAKQSVLADVNDIPFEQSRERVLVATQGERAESTIPARTPLRERASHWFGWRTLGWTGAAAALVLLVVAIINQSLKNSSPSLASSQNIYASRIETAPLADNLEADGFWKQASALDAEIQALKTYF